MHRGVIIIPCYNEAERLKVDSFKEFAAQGDSHELLFVNDGSTDDTLEILRSLSDCNPGQFQVQHLRENVGKAEAVRRGILRAWETDPDFVGFWDADLATPLAVIPQFCALLEDHPQLQMVFGSRVRLLGRTIQRRALRHYLGRVFATGASLVLGLPVYDTQCGAKLFRATPEIRALFERPFRSRWIFDVELLARFVLSRHDAGPQQAEKAIYEFPLTEWRDIAGSKLRFSASLKAACELVVIYWTYRLRGRRRPEPAEPATSRPTLGR